MSVPSSQRLIEEPDESSVALSPAEQSAVLEELAEVKERARQAERALEKTERAKAREADSKFGFLKKLTVGVIKCGVYRENPRTYEYEYVPEGSVMWNVDREDKTAFQDRMAKLFGAGRYRIEMQFPKDSGIEDSILEISISEKPESAVEKPAPPPSNDNSMAAEFAKVVVEMQNSNREFFKWMMELSQKQTAEMADQSQKQNAAIMEAVKTSMVQTSRPDPSRDDMLKLVTELVKAQGGNVKQVDPITMLTGLAQTLTSLKLLVPTPTASGGIDAAQIMPQIVNAIKLGAELGGGGGAAVEAAEGEGTLDKLINFIKPLMPILGGLMVPKPQATLPPPPIQQSTTPPAQPSQTRPQPRDVKPRRVQPAPSSPTQKTPPQTQPQEEEAIDTTKAVSDIDQLVETINTLSPEDAAAEIKQKVNPAFLEFAKEPDKVLALVSNFRPELKNDGMFGIKLRQVCAALNK